MSLPKFRLLASLEPHEKFSVVVVVVFRVTLVFCFGPKPKFCSFDSDLMVVVVIFSIGDLGVMLWS